ncbi:MAG TPA: hypothetical protein VIH57_07530, partial [Bacteroidales bacterium]
MKLTKYCLWFCFCFVVILNSCNQKVEVSSEQAGQFVKFLGGSAIDKAMDVKPCTDGGYALTGTLSSESNVSTAFFIKTDQYGNEANFSPVLLGDGAEGIGYSVCQTSDGNFLVAGSIVANGRTDRDILVDKINKDGSIAWKKSFGGMYDDEAYSVIE